MYLLTFGKVRECKVHYTHFTSCKSAIGGSPLSLTSLFPPNGNVWARSLLYEDKVVAQSSV